MNYKELLEQNKYFELFKYLYNNKIIKKNNDFYYNKCNILYLIHENENFDCVLKQKLNTAILFEKYKDSPFSCYKYISQHHNPSLLRIEYSETFYKLLQNDYIMSKLNDISVLLDKKNILDDNLKKIVNNNIQEIVNLHNTKS